MVIVKEQKVHELNEKFKAFRKHLEDYDKILCLKGKRKLVDESLCIIKYENSERAGSYGISFSIATIGQPRKIILAEEQKKIQTRSEKKKLDDITEDVQEMSFDVGKINKCWSLVMNVIRAKEALLDVTIK